MSVWRVAEAEELFTLRDVVHHEAGGRRLHDDHLVDRLADRLAGHVEPCLQVGRGWAFHDGLVEQQHLLG
ncbi:MAG: hypothetical protein RLZZ67_418 [Candidatus Parcubacteria bacterium]